MSVAEMKLEAINKISSLHGEMALREIIKHLNQLQEQERNSGIQNMQNIFEEAAVQYGNTLKKLAQ